MLRPTAASRAIAQGLVRTGHAEGDAEFMANAICLPRCAGGYFYLDYSGHWLRRGEVFRHSEELQDGFVAAMRAAGQRGAGQN